MYKYKQLSLQEALKLMDEMYPYHGYTNNESAWNCCLYCNKKWISYEKMVWFQRGDYPYACCSESCMNLFIFEDINGDSED